MWNPTTAGLWRIEGLAADSGSTVPWSLVLKVIRAADGTTDPASPGYWRREPLVYQSGLLHALPPGVAVPACFGVATPSPETVWLWLEEIDDAGDAPWPLARYALAARHLGRLSGRYLVLGRCPAFPWLHRAYLGAWATHGAEGIAQLPALRGHPLVGRVYPAPVRAQLVRLWEQRAEYVAALAQLPQTLCHMDALRRNMIARPRAGAEEQTVLLDWGEAGIGAPGEELAAFLTASVFLEAGTPSARALEASALPAYLAGLRDVGWEGDAALVRRAYRIAAALRLLGGTTWILQALLAADAHGDLEHALGRPFSQSVEHWAEATLLVLEGLTAAGL